MLHMNHLNILAHRGHCRIVVVSSMAAVVPAPGQAMYSATKLALHGYFATLQSELNDRHVTLSSWTATCIPLPTTSAAAQHTCLAQAQSGCDMLVHAMSSHLHVEILLLQHVLASEPLLVVFGAPDGVPETEFNPDEI